MLVAVKVNNNKPSVVESGKNKLQKEYKEVQDRLEFVGGDFFASVPSGGTLPGYPLCVI